MSIVSKIKDFLFIQKEITRLKSMESAHNQGLEIVFYAETKNDWIYFEGLVMELLEKRSKTVVYLTSSRDDKAFKVGHGNFHPFFVGEGGGRTLLFKTIKCKTFVMTLTDLDQFHLKRSVNPVHYVYLFHSILSAHMIYREKSFNSYDTFFTVGPHHDQEINALNQFYQVDKKEIVPFGYYRLEKLLNENKKIKADNKIDSLDINNPNILIAPSWGKSSITQTVLTPLIEELLKSDCQITFRPHPMSFRKSPQILTDLQKKFESNSNVHFDFDIRNSDSLRNADIMISDWSGAAFEFAFGFEKPVLFVNTKPKINNKDYSQLESAEMEPIEKGQRTSLGEVLEPDRLEEVNLKIKKLLENQDATHQKLIESRDKYIYHLGNSSQVGADYLVNYLDNAK